MAHHLGVSTVFKCFLSVFLWDTPKEWYLMKTWSPLCWCTTRYLTLNAEDVCFRQPSTDNVICVVFSRSHRYAAVGPYEQQRFRHAELYFLRLCSPLFVSIPNRPRHGMLLAPFTGYSFIQPPDLHCVCSISCSLYDQTDLISLKWYFGRNRQSSNGRVVEFVWLAAGQPRRPSSFSFSHSMAPQSLRESTWQKDH